MPLGAESRSGSGATRRCTAKVLGSDRAECGYCDESVVVELTVLQVRVTVTRTFLLDDHRVNRATGESHCHLSSVLSCRPSTHRSVVFTSRRSSSLLLRCSVDYRVRVVPCPPLSRTSMRCLFRFSFPSRLFPSCAVVYAAGR